jgi:hypothetical protein
MSFITADFALIVGTGNGIEDSTVNSADRPAGRILMVAALPRVRIEYCVP